MSLYIVAREPGAKGTKEVAAVDLGPYQLLHKIKSAVAHLLEGDIWGDRFPLLMNSSDTDAYYGPEEVGKLYAEMEQLVHELELRSPAELRPDDEPHDPMLPTQLLNGSAANLADYFLTVDGQPVLRVLLDLCRIAASRHLEIAFT